MDRMFLIHGNNNYTYNELVADISSKRCLPKYLYIHQNDPYELFTGLLCSIVRQCPITLLDGDFSMQELESLGITPDKLKLQYQFDKLTEVSSCEHLRDLILQADEWDVTLYTTGTTGRPKEVRHKIESLLRNVKVGARFHDHVWAFAYNPSHIAGLQVLFQALLNCNTIVYAFDGMQNKLAEAIDQYAITHLSATSTYYRSVLPLLKGPYMTVRQTTFGGERFDSQLCSIINEQFPNARITNIYASTEAGSLFSSNGEFFEVPESLSAYVRINDDNELLLHRSLLGYASFLENDWMATGDIVEQVENKRFRFVSRNSDFVNIGGYNVNPHETEKYILQVPGVLDAAVKAKANSVSGHILVAEVVMDSGYDEKELKLSIKQYAAEHLQPWKVPRIIYIVKEIEKSRTAKKVRR